MSKVFYDLCANPFFGLFLTVGSFYIGDLVAKKVKSPLANPLLIAMIICVAVLKLFHIPYEDYMKGAQYVIFLGTGNGDAWTFHLSAEKGAEGRIFPNCDRVSGRKPSVHGKYGDPLPDAGAAQ